MGGICGWHGPATGELGPTGTLRNMVSGLFRNGDSVFEGGADNVRGLGIVAAPSSASIHREESVWAAIEGAPRWSDRDLAGIATRKGHAAALVTAYRERGDGLFAVLRGSWALSIVDGGTGRTLLAIDRAGVRPLCFAKGRDGALRFGSTVESVARTAEIDRQINLQSIYDYLFSTRIPAPETIYSAVRKLLPGQYMSWEDGRIELASYWSMRYQEDEDAGLDRLSAELEEVLEAAVRRAVDGFDGDDIGTFLSGGLDSSTITGLLGRLSNRSVMAFTVGFSDEDYDEMRFARTAAAHFGAEHHEYYVTARDVVELVPKLAEAYDEPFGNSSAIPAYYCARLARDAGVRLMLAGDGGDELFAGNKRYARQLIFERYGVLPAWVRRSLVEPAIFGIPFGDQVLPIRKARRFIERANIPLPDRLEIYNFYGSYLYSDIFADGVQGAISPDHPLELLREQFGKADTASQLNKMLDADLRFTLADDDLRKVGRTAEMASVTVRYPFLDDDVMAFAGRVPSALKLKGSRLRYFFKYAMRDFLPKTTLAKPKQGFGLPFGPWLRSDRDVQALAYDSLDALKRRGIFRSTFLDEVSALSQSGHASYHGDLVWVLMLLEQWLEKHHDTSGAGA